ncbi:hypothetical protein AD998_21205 [bacterium 336/3]|nr:hypothetical protein AD998_21205 [bacterium 336/3]
MQQKLNDLANTGNKGLKELANFSVSDAPIQDFLRSVAETHNLNISIDPNIKVLITNNFTNASVINILLYLCQEYELDIRFFGNILSFVKYVPTQEKVAYSPKKLKLIYDDIKDWVSVDLANDSLSLFAKQITQLTHKNVLVASGVPPKLLSAYVEKMPFKKGLEKIALTNGLVLSQTDDSTYILELPAGEIDKNGKQITNNISSNNSKKKTEIADGASLKINKQNGNTFIDIDAINTPIADLIKMISSELGINYVLFSDVKGNTTLRVKNITYDSFLSLILQGTAHTYKTSQGVYLIGERVSEGFRSVSLVKLAHRPSEKIDEMIPKELKQGVEIKVMEELNAVILSGSSPQIQEIKLFLQAIDQPVKNVLIEVIVVEIRKGNTIKTGIKAGVSDSTVRTGGEILSGLDFTLGSKAINRFLSTLSSGAGINIGRVTSNFYLTLQALETNENLQVRSTPKLSTLNGHEANLTIGQSVYYVEQTQNINPGVTPITTITQRFQRVNADLNIKINPKVSEDENITLDVSAEFSDFIPPTVNGAPPGNATRKFTSKIRVKNEEMIVLGGLEEARQSNSGSGVPLLSRIPILKWLFSSRTKTKQKNKLVVFIKPTLIH